MEIKTKLIKPYTENEKINFIVEQNHNNGYEIRETETALEAWGYTEEEKAQKERKRLDNLSMTRGDVFEALILAKGLGKAQIRSMIEQVVQVCHQVNILSFQLSMQGTNIKVR